MVELSSIISAVKPKERTDQYVILAALFALNARGVPVTATQIRDILILHLGKKHIPSNINTSLRAYTGLVDPAEKGPPMKWSLTPNGIERLRTLSGLALATPSISSDFETDVGVVCALEHPEFSALRDAFGGETKWTGASDARYSHIYRETELQISSSKKVRVVGTSATSMGLTAAAIATTQLVLQFRPRIVLMVGIAAGTKNGGKQFGDILVADPSVDYNSGKVVDTDGIREFLPDPYPIGLYPRIRSLLQKYRSEHPIFDTIRARWSGKVPPKKNRLHLGPLGAADQVIDDARRVLEIQHNWRKLIGVEMETYAVYRACTEAPDPKPRFVSFKSVCDFAAEKADSWQPFAAFMAAQFTLEFLKLEWDSIWPKLTSENL